MNYNYILIDMDFINLIEEKKREVLKDNMYRMYLSTIMKKRNALNKKDYFKSLTRVKFKAIYIYCAYCKNCYMMGINGKLEQVKMAKSCVICGESNIYEKAAYGLRKVNNLIDIGKRLNVETDKELINDLNHQIIVLLASKMEVFFRDYYKTFLNIKIIKSGHSEIERFEKDCKNDFINIHKTNDRFRKELNLDIKAIIGVDKYKSMEEISAYRNVIVHNNGLCDKKFLNLNIGNYNDQDPIIITPYEINQYLSITKSIIDEVGKTYEQVYRDEMIKEIESTL